MTITAARSVLETASPESMGIDSAALDRLYAQIEGHIEAGSEWFRLTKKHESGEVWFRISASWHEGEFPNWWSHLGFRILGARYQLAWHRLAYLRLRELVGTCQLGPGPRVPELPEGRQLIHSGHRIQDARLWVLNFPIAAEKVRRIGARQSRLHLDPLFTHRPTRSCAWDSTPARGAHRPRA